MLEIDTSPGFLGITNTDARDEAMALQLPELIRRTYEALRSQAQCSADITSMIDIADTYLVEDDKLGAVLRTVNRSACEWDGNMCKVAGYMEVMIARLNAVSPTSDGSPVVLAFRSEERQP